MLQYVTSFGMKLGRMGLSFSFCKPLRAGVLAMLMASGGLMLAPRAAQAQQAPYCMLSAAEITQKESLRRAALSGDRPAADAYRRLLRQHGDQMRRCRNESWLKDQAIWLRLYPCDVRPGSLETILDQVVNRGYNQVYVEVFYSGQVLLPRSSNRTAWPSVVRNPGYENRDLLAEAIAKGRDRGLKVYAWMFTMNFGYTYAQRPDAHQILALNGQGETSITLSNSARVNNLDDGNGEEVFIDPYNRQAKTDYHTLVQATLQRRPDGMLFDYIRYPRGAGAASVAGQVRDLWIYGPASQQALYQRATNPSGQDVIQRYHRRGFITLQDVINLTSLYPQDPQPLWQGISPDPAYPTAPPEQRQPFLQTQLWQLAVSHAFQGVLDFLMLAASPVRQQNLAAGAVFFPEANQMVGQGGYDSRLQFWDRFPSSLEWHPMAYALCSDGRCVAEQVQRVVSAAPAGTKVIPALAGTWGKAVSGHPPLEVQMQAIRQTSPNLTALSHFAFSWQNPEWDNERKFCRLQ